MTNIIWPGNNNWSLTQKIIFRFFFIYLLLYIAPWTWIEYIPGADNIVKYYYQFVDWAVHSADQYLFNYKKLITRTGSGDTSYNWTQLWLYIILSMAGCIIWSLFDRKRNQYNQLSYWLRVSVRFFLIMNCFGYGISKLFSLQMPFPNMSQLATPLGDYLPMRLSWMFMGYSDTYQSFSGAMEVFAGILLFFRRTATAGSLLAAAVFGNVMMMNMGYDIPVKLFSMHLFIMSLLLVAFEYKRILGFFLFNQAVPAGNLYNIRFPKKWMRITRIILKCYFVFIIVIMSSIDKYKNYKEVKNPKEIKPIRSGIYDVTVFVLNKDTIPPLITDTLRWQDVIFEYGGGSIKTTDTLFRQRYGRGYFSYIADTIKQEIEFNKTNVDRQRFFLFRLKYELPDSNSIRLSGMIRKDSVDVLLRKSKRQFQLAERQFHWLSEYNR
jgi:hypothetical protein